jgi:histidine triad (HIT) family protein
VDDCLFCKIIKGDIPSYKVYEDDKVFAFLDIAGDADGHTLVVPKTHCRNLLDAPASVAADVLEGVQKVARHYVADCGYEGVSVVNFNEHCAGQTVFHLHFHVYPRTIADGVTLVPGAKNAKCSLEEMQKKVAFE